MRHQRDWTVVAEDVAILGVSQACQKHGIHRSTWYRHLVTTGREIGPAPPDLAQEILAISAERPSWGCDRIAYYLGLAGIRVSSPTVQKILISQGLGRREEREARVPGSAPAMANPPSR